MDCTSTGRGSSQRFGEGSNRCPGRNSHTNQGSDLHDQSAKATLTALSSFDPERKLRFRSSTNLEDQGQFTGAGLYDSFSGCLEDELDDDEQGLCACDSHKAKERGVFRAIKSLCELHNENAYRERRLHRIEEPEVGMALLVHHSFPDEIEWANGVAVVQFTDYSGGAFNLRTELVTR